MAALMSRSGEKGRGKGDQGTKDSSLFDRLDQKVK